LKNIRSGFEILASDNGKNARAIAGNSSLTTGSRDGRRMIRSGK
jgi:hypothetical protein